MLIKDVRNSLKNFKPDDEIWIHFITKDDIKEMFSNCEYTDENDKDRKSTRLNSSHT